MKTQKIFKTKFILILILSLALAISAVGLISVNKVKANVSNLPELVLPSSNLEYKALNNPIDAILDNNFTAILEEKKLIVYKDNEYYELTNNDLIENHLSAVNQIKKLPNAQNIILLSDDAKLKQVDVSKVDGTRIAEPTDQAFTVMTKPNVQDTIGCAYFDTNGSFLVTTYGTTLTIYSLSADGMQTTTSDNGNTIKEIANNSPIAINDNDIFYIKNGELRKHTISTDDDKKLTDVVPSKLIANNEYVYYILNQSLYRISVNGGDPHELTKPQNGNFELGNVNAPTSLSFYGNDLIISGENSIQQLKLTDDVLEFTGFAIAKGKSAFNRINDSVKEIEREKDTLATLDDNNLTLINVGEGFSSYNKDLFSHVATSSLKKNEELPASFALGDNSALFLYDVNNINSRNCLAFLPDISKPETLSDVSIENGLNYTDILYQSGKYYVLSHKNATSSQVYVSAQGSTLSFSLFAQADGIHANQMAIDVFGNVYLSTGSSVYALNKETKTATALNSTPISNIKKLQTDLAGKVFALCDTDIYCYNGNEWSSVTFDTQGKTFSSFTVDYDKKDVYMIYTGEELIVKTSTISNVAIDDIKPQTFVATASSAKDDLKTYTAKEGANVYSVNKTESGFIFNELIAEPTDYAFITQVTKDNVTLFALAGQDQLVLINSNEVTETTPTKDFAVSENAFITTSVNAYYLPIITEKADYALTDGEVVRLSKEQIIKPKHKITFLNKDYYFAEFTLDEKTYNGYVPIDYTIEVLSQDFKWDNYTIEKVSATTVYREKELVNAITELADDTSVRVISVENDVAYIAFETENGYINGYIDASDIKDNPSVAIRNILIIIAVMASVCGTTTYFILRKKR